MIFIFFIGFQFGFLLYYFEVTLYQISKVFSDDREKLFLYSNIDEYRNYVDGVG